MPALEDQVKLGRCPGAENHTEQSATHGRFHVWSFTTEWQSVLRRYYYWLAARLKRFSLQRQFDMDFPVFGHAVRALENFDGEFRHIVCLLFCDDLVRTGESLDLPAKFEAQALEFSLKRRAGYLELLGEE